MDWDDFKGNLFCIDRNLEIQELEFVCDEKMDFETTDEIDSNIAKVYQEIKPFTDPKTRLVFKLAVTHAVCPSFFLKKEDAIRHILKELISERGYSIRAMDAKIKMFEDMIASVD